jgi:hypothetical protein
MMRQDNRGHAMTLEVGPLGYVVYACSRCGFKSSEDGAGHTVVVDREGIQLRGRMMTEWLTARCGEPRAN